MFFSRNPTQGACSADHHPHDCGAIGSITGENRSGGDIRAHRDLLSVPGAADLIEIEGCGKVPLSVDLRFQIGDLLLRSGNGVGAGPSFTRSNRGCTTGLCPLQRSKRAKGPPVSDCQSETDKPPSTANTCPLT